MKSRVSIAVMLIAVAVGCSSLQVSHEYEREADFSSFATFAWQEGDTNMSDTNPLAHERFINAVNGQLQSRSLAEVSSDPDVFLKYNTEEYEKRSLSTTYMGGHWGYGPDWTWGLGLFGGLEGSTTQGRVFNMRNVVLDMWDAKQSRLVWRGVASDTISDNPQQDAAKITRAAQEIFEDYPPTRE